MKKTIEMFTVIIIILLVGMLIHSVISDYTLRHACNRDGILVIDHQEYKCVPTGIWTP